MRFAMTARRPGQIRGSAHVIGSSAVQPSSQYGHSSVGSGCVRRQPALDDLIVLSVVEVARADFPELTDERVAAAWLQVSDKPTVEWTLALSDGQTLDDQRRHCPFAVATGRRRASGR